MRTARTDLLDNRYRLVRRLEGGGVAEVWLAQDVRLGRPVAIKRLYPQYTENREFLARLEQEARAVARLDDPRIVRIYDVVIRPNERAYLVLEYVPGRDLRAYLAEACPLPLSTALKLLREIAHGVAAAHHAGFIHRDLKPANILLGRNGSIKVADFGLARSRAGSGLTEPGTVWGTSHYLAPEQARGATLTPAVDVYALGVIFFEMVTGTVPFRGDDPLAVALAHVQEPLPDLRRLAPSVPPGLARYVGRMLGKDPAERPGDAGEVAAFLGRYLGATEEPTAAHPVVELAPRSLPQPPDRAAGEPTQRRRWTRPLFVAGILLFLLAGLATFVPGQRTRLLERDGAYRAVMANGGASPTPRPTATSTGEPRRPPSQGGVAGPAATKTVVERKTRLRSGNGPDLRAAPRLPLLQVDGRLAEWLGPGAPVTTRVAGEPTSIGRDDLSGELWAAWDDRNLYLAVRVTDDVLVQTGDGTGITGGDVVEFWLDADLAGDFDDAEANGDDWHFAFSPGDFAASLPEGVILRPPGQANRRSTVRVRAFPSAAGYGLEVQLPWELLDVQPEPGAAFGYGLTVADRDDTAEAAGQVQVAASATFQSDRPGTWGNLILEP